MPATTFIYDRWAEHFRVHIATGIDGFITSAAIQESFLAVKNPLSLRRACARNAKLLEDVFAAKLRTGKEVVIDAGDTDLAKAIEEKTGRRPSAQPDTSFSTKTGAYVLHVFRERNAKGHIPSRKAASAEFATWLGNSWPRLSKEERAVLTTVGAALYGNGKS